MSISAYESFLGYDWVRYSGIASKVTCTSCGIIGFLTIFFGFSLLYGLWSIFAAVVMAVWEFPWIFCCIPKFDQVQTFLNDKLQLKLEEVKAVVCILLSVLCFMSKSITVISGILLVLTGILYIFAAINRRQDQRDGFVQVDQEQPYVPKNIPTPVTFTAATASTASSLLGGSNKFGTF